MLIASGFCDPLAALAGLEKTPIYLRLKSIGVMWNT